MKTVIIDYGSGNLHSALKAFERASGTTGKVAVTSERLRVDNRRIKRCAVKGIGEALGEALERVGPRVERDRGACVMRDLAQIVDSVAMIGMIVGNDHAGDIGGVGDEQLFAHVRAAIHQ